MALIHKSVYNRKSEGFKKSYEAFKKVLNGTEGVFLRVTQNGM